jgi:hypothetical protein
MTQGGLFNDLPETASSGEYEAEGKPRRDTLRY